MDDIWTPEEFRRIVNNTLERGVIAEQIADACGVSVSTVMRWASGAACPIECVRQGILEMLVRIPKSFAANDNKKEHQEN